MTLSKSLLNLKKSTICAVTVLFVISIYQIYSFYFEISDLKGLSLSILIFLYASLSIFFLLKKNMINLYSTFAPINYVTTIFVIVLNVFFDCSFIVEFIIMFFWATFNFCASIHIAVSNFSNLSHHNLYSFFDSSKKLDVFVSILRKPVFLLDVGNTTFAFEHVTVNKTKYDIFNLELFIKDSKLKLNNFSKDDLTLFEMINL